MKELTKAEEQIMQVIWDNEEILIKDVIDRLPEPKPAYNTVGTFLKILETKGFVKRRKIANTFMYSSGVEKSAYTNKFMSSVIGRYFEGSVEKLFSFMVDEKKLDLKQVEELMKKMKDND
jgi:BlaI family transcriptional regulator, penicillinase repressor